MWLSIEEDQHTSMVTAEGLEGGQDGGFNPHGPEVTATEGAWGSCANEECR
jgi:hypothetical protein